MTIKQSAKCPCTRDCPDRCAEPNCHSENGNCPHGYLEWRKALDEKKSAIEKAREKEASIERYVAAKPKSLRKKR